MTMVPSDGGLQPAERVLGFDARVRSGDSAWPSDALRGSLVRSDVTRPSSVDIAIWPSVFACGADVRAGFLTFAPLARPEWTGWNGILWDKLDQLQARLDAAAGSALPAYALVAVTSWSAAADATHPPDPTWRRLGFDIADAWLDSGLSNMWSADALETARERFSNRLNQHHLFPRLDDAREFRAYSDRRVPQHAPFSVYGIYELRTVA